MYVCRAIFLFLFLSLKVILLGGVQTTNFMSVNGGLRGQNRPATTCPLIALMMLDLRPLKSPKNDNAEETCVDSVGYFFFGNIA